MSSNYSEYVSRHHHYSTNNSMFGSAKEDLIDKMTMNKFCTVSCIMTDTGFKKRTIP